MCIRDRIYNCGGYESVDSLRMLEGKVQIYLPDFKYVDNQLAIRYSGTADYFEQAGAAIREMVRQTGPYRLDQDGMLCSCLLYTSWRIHWPVAALPLSALSKIRFISVLIEGPLPSEAVKLTHLSWCQTMLF